MMKIKAIALLLLAVMCMYLFSANQTAAQEIISENLFTNPGFEDGHANQDQIPQILVPNGWRLVWLDNQPFEGTNELPAYRPEATVWKLENAPLNERSLFFRDGIYTLKVWKVQAPMYTALWQTVTGLEVGRKYRISAPIFVDIVEDYEGGQKVPPEDLSHGFVRFGVGPAGSTWLVSPEISYSPYWTAENVNPFYLVMQTYTWDFVAAHSDVTVFIEMGSKAPYENNGFFMDAVGLHALNETSNVSAPPPAPAAGGGNSGGGASAAPAAPAPAIEVTPREDGSIIHIVGANDSFWTIAIRYAPTLNMPPEEALPHIQGLNGSPQFVIAGQELLIRAPGNYGDTPTGGSSAGAETSAATTPEGGEESREAETGQDVIVVEGEPLAGTDAPAVTVTPEALPPSGICISAFEDENGNGQFDESTEALKAEAAITLLKDGRTQTTYITDGVTSEHCFEDLETGAYEVKLFPPANYMPTTADSWAITVNAGELTPVQFGMQRQEVQVVEVAEVNTDEMETAVMPIPTTAPAALAAEGGGGTNVGLIVVTIAIILILLAGAGVVMLRRG